MAAKKTLNECRSLLELVQVFKDDATCRKYLETNLWGANPVCPHCATEDKIYRFSNQKTFKCGTCKKQFTVTVGTIFEDSHVSLLKWFMAIWLVTNKAKGIASTQLALEIGVQQRTAWYMLQRIRYALKNDTLKRGKLKGIVEADEMFISPNPRNIHEYKKSTMRKFKGKGKQINNTKAVVIGMVERGKGGLIITRVITDAKSKTIVPQVRKHVEPFCQLMTDGYYAYRSMKRTYIHEHVDHSVGEYVRGNVHTNSIEGHWGLFQRGYVGVYHSMSKKHLQFYLNEFDWRHNHKDLTQQQKVGKVLSSSVGRIKYKDLIKSV
jgi:transposase-like protein